MLFMGICKFIGTSSMVEWFMFLFCSFINSYKYFNCSNYISCHRALIQYLWEHSHKKKEINLHVIGLVKSYISRNWKLINNNPKPKALKLISASSKLTTTSQELNDMPMNIVENEYETIEDEY